MEFYVYLIQVKKLDTEQIKSAIYPNCIYIINDIWIYEGDLLYLKDEEVNFTLIDEGIIESIGDMSQKDLIKYCKERFNPKPFEC